MENKVNVKLDADFDLWMESKRQELFGDDDASKKFMDEIISRINEGVVR